MDCYVRRVIITQNCQVDIKCMKRGKCELVNVNETVFQGETLGGELDRVATKIKQHMSIHTHKHR